MESLTNVMVVYLQCRTLWYFSTKSRQNMDSPMSDLSTRSQSTVERETSSGQDIRQRRRNSATTGKNAKLFSVKSIKMGLNYGLNKARFPNPVPVNSQLRMISMVFDMKEKFFLNRVKRLKYFVTFGSEFILEVSNKNWFIFYLSGSNFCKLDKNQMGIFVCIRRNFNNWMDM